MKPKGGNRADDDLVLFLRERNLLGHHLRRESERVRRRRRESFTIVATFPSPTGNSRKEGTQPPSPVLWVMLMGRVGG